LIAYGDMRFTDPTSTKAANPDAVQLTGDIRDSFSVKKK
jgi:hypothetical protein